MRGERIASTRVARADWFVLVTAAFILALAPLLYLFAERAHTNLANAHSIWLLHILAVALLAARWQLRGALAGLAVSLAVALFVELGIEGLQEFEEPAVVVDLALIGALNVIISLAVGWLSARLTRTNAGLRQAEQTNDALREAEARYRALLEQLPSMVYIDAIDDASTNLYTGPELAALTGHTHEEWESNPELWLELTHPDDLERVRAEHLRSNRDLDPFSIEYRLRTKDGRWIWVHDNAQVVRAPDGEPLFWHGIWVDITARKRSEDALAGQNHILQLISAGEPLPDVLRALCLHLEELLAGGMCSILLLDDGGRTLHHGAAPSLDPAYTSAIDGAAIGPDAGACGSAAWHRREVVCSDIASDPLWVDYRALALGHDLRACWSVPVIDDAGAVLGTFAIYYREPRQPREDELALMREASSLARIAIQRADAEARLRESEYRGTQIVEASIDAIVTIDGSGRIVEFNPAAERTFGYTRQQAIGELMGDLLVPPLLRDSHRAGLERYLRTGTPAILGQRIEAIAMRADGAIFPVELAVTCISSDGPPRFAGHIRDITERKSAEEALRNSEQRFRSLVQHSNDIITVIDLDGVVRYVTPSIERLLGWSPDEQAGKPLLESVHADDRERALRFFAQVYQSDGVHGPTEFAFLHRDGSWRTLEAVAANLATDPSVNGVVINARDVTERRRFEEQLERQAFHDALTGLPNRALLTDRIMHALARTQRSDERVAILFLDLDRFKVINDSLGHAVGDDLLVQIARRLEGCRRAGDTVARLGGDEFVFLLEGVLSSADVTGVAQRVVDALRDPFQLSGEGAEGAEAFVTSSIGIALSTPGLTDAGELLRMADIALYRAKGSGRSNYALYEPSMNVFSAGRLALETDLRHAVERGQLRVFYQPELCLAAGAVTGFEALARWEHPEQGMIPPVEFIPLAEETGLIVPIGRWVLLEACRQARIWATEFDLPHPCIMSVNLSARQFQEPDLVQQVAEVLAETGLEPHLLRLEITESVVLHEVESTLATLRQLKALGVQLAIDDFGIGYSSLSYLTRLAADVIKIDRSFVQGVEDDGRALSIVGAVATLAHALGMHVNAEGIETAGQLTRIRAAGCDLGQGYYFARPLPAGDMRAFMHAAGEIATPSTSRNGHGQTPAHVHLVSPSAALADGGCGT